MRKRKNGEKCGKCEEYESAKVRECEDAKVRKVRKCEKCEKRKVRKAKSAKVRKYENATSHIRQSSLPSCIRRDGESIAFVTEFVCLMVFSCRCGGCGQSSYSYN